MIRKISPALWFWIAWIVLCFALGHFRTLSLPPTSMHQGAQADRACVAWNYYNESMNFFLPRVMESRAWDGIAGMEFPAIPYSVALLYKIFGPHEYLYRGLLLLIVSFGVFATWLITGFFIRNNFNRIILVLGWYLSPILAYYTPNYLPDPAALSFSMIAWYLFFRFYFQINVKPPLIGYTVFITLAGLIKVSYLITHFAVFGLVLLQWLPMLKLPLRVPVRKIHLLWFLIPFIPIAGWYKYSADLTAKTWNVHFLQQANPAHSIAEFAENTRYAFTNWQSSLHAGYLFYFVVAFILITAIFQYKKSTLLSAATLFLFLGFLAIFALFNVQYKYHDYYLILLFPFLFFGMLNLQQIFVENKTTFIGLVPILMMLGFYYFPIKNYFHTKHMLAERYSDGNYYNQRIFDGIKTYELHDGQNISTLPKNAFIVSAFDPTPNTTLYMLRRKGVRIAPDFSPELAADIIHKSPARYIVINDTTLWFKKFEPVVKSTGKLIHRENQVFFYEVIKSN